MPLNLLALWPAPRSPPGTGNVLRSSSLTSLALSQQQHPASRRVPTVSEMRAGPPECFLPAKQMLRSREANRLGPSSTRTRSRRARSIRSRRYAQFSHCLYIIYDFYVRIARATGSQLTVSAPAHHQANEHGKVHPVEAARTGISRGGSWRNRRGVQLQPDGAASNTGSRRTAPEGLQGQEVSVFFRPSSDGLP